jgi:hypothetical protein
MGWRRYRKVVVPSILLIVIAAGEANDPTVRTVAATAQEALGTHARVLVRESAGAPSDADALAAERSEGADITVELSWTAARHQQALLRMHVVRTDRWVQRVIGFASSDIDAERGRTLGYAIASIAPESSGGGTVDTAAASTATAPIQGPPASRETAVGGTTASMGGAERQATAPLTEARFALDLLASAADDIGVDAKEVGGSATLEWLPRRWLSVRLGGGLRGGPLDAVQATTMTGWALAGAGVRLAPWRARIPAAFSFRAEFLVVYEMLAHFANGNPTPDDRSGLLPGADLMADASWGLTPDVELILGGGIEDVFASTEVTVRGVGVQRATLSPWHASLEGGLRLRF